MNRREMILQRLEQYQTGAKRSLGQNFLVSDAVVNKILFAVKAEPFSDLIEVGPGLGALTEDLLGLNKKLLLIELDQRFAEFWKKRSEDLGEGSLRVIEGDALQIDWDDLHLSLGSLFVSNLPYQISSSMVIERCLSSAGITRMILMFQKEVAQRISARHGMGEYGLLTVMAQTFWDIATVSEAGPKDFYPPPNVASRVLVFRRRNTEWVNTLEGRATPQRFLRLVKAGFSHRRKLLKSNILNGLYLGDKSKIVALEEVMRELTLKDTARAEELSPAQFVRLFLELLKRGALDHV